MGQKSAEQQKKRNKIIFGSLRVMVTSALLIAMSIVCGKYLKIPVGDVMRFSFENLPILLAGIAFGPLAGMATGVIADLIGCVLVGYAINPLVTLGAAAIGALGGLLYHLCNKLPLFVRLLITVMLSHTIGSVVIKTFGLAKFYDLPFFELVLWRSLNYLIVGIIELAVLYVVLKNKAVSSLLQRLGHK